MPCRCDGFEELEDKKIRKHLNRMARLLCYACGELMYAGLFDKVCSMNPGLKRWFSRHHASDVKRVRAKMLSALRAEPEKENSAGSLAERFASEARKVHPISRWHEDWFVDMAKDARLDYLALLKRKRKAKKIAMRALGKLTLEERKVLGV